MDARKWLFTSLLALLVCCDKQVENQREDFPTPFEQGNGNTTATYPETLEFYRKLAREFPDINMQTLGSTDSGEPLHLITYNPEGNFNFQRLGSDKTVVLILNGIHPGEPDGIDASMLLLRDLASGAITLPEKIIPVVVPVYNIGGALQRNSHTRANQNGPEQYGFRGNARNFDLNRDFIKMDTRNAASFAEIFHLVQPDLFLDTHVSNGADYSYTLTHLFTQHDRLGGALGAFQEETLRPDLERDLAEKGWEITPYVNVFNRSPETGFAQFMDSPRYSTGYAALWSVPGLMLETHMLKPYPERVAGTYAFLRSFLELAARHGDTLQSLREASLARFAAGAYYPLGWELDSTRTRPLQFRGFEAETPLSEVTGLPRLRYDRSRPYTREVAYYDGFRASDSVRIPSAYLVPRQWESVRERMDRNHIRYETIDRDTVLAVTSYRIAGFQTYSMPYEGHYPHYGTRVEADTLQQAFRQGDLFIPTDQPGVRYLLETLEPQGADSFFNWNFFDTVLQRKEGFSPYVFEDIAGAMLASDSLLARAFREAREADPNLASNSYAQLDWVYRHSPYYETAHLRYPVYRVE